MMEEGLEARLATFFQAGGLTAYLVGGAVRDFALGRPLHDLDVAVAGDALAAGAALARHLGGTLVVLDETNPTARVMLGSALHVDLTQVRGGEIGADLALRDFTINAMAMRLWPAAPDPNVGEARLTPGPAGPGGALIDPWHGLDDLRAGLMRLVGDSSFRDDPIRLLRTVRFRAELGFEIVPETLDLMRRDAALIATAAGERVRDELAASLACPGAAGHLRLLGETGLLAGILPEMAAPPEAPPPEDARNPLDHTLRVVAETEWATGAGAAALFVADAGAGGEVAAIPAVAAGLAGYLAARLPGGRGRRALLKLAALLHDAGKAEGQSAGLGGGAGSAGHPEGSAAVAAAVMRRLRFSARETAAVRTMVACHRRPDQLAQEEMTRRAIYRYFRDCGEEGVGGVLLSLAHHRADGGPGTDAVGWRSHLAVARRLLAAYYSEPERAVAPRRLVAGAEIMAELGIPAGRAVGSILEAVREAQAAGDVSTREEALALARRLARATAE